MMYEENEVDDLFYQPKENKMNNGLFQISWVNIKSALVSAIITAVLGMAGYIIGIGDIFKLDVHTLVNIGALAALTSIVSLLKAFLTTSQGNFVGSVQVQPD